MLRVFVFKAAVAAVSQAATAKEGNESLMMMEKDSMGLA
jgi:hypothetical protein